MNLLAYGEDALTLWALRNKIGLILETLDDSSVQTNCQAFYRPSFGRSGGPGSPQFGELDFILLTEHRVYLGESKWDGSSERIIDGKLELRDEQLMRHQLMRFYIEEWAFGDHKDWHSFKKLAEPLLADWGIEKLIVPADKLLATNLQYVLGVIRRKFTVLPEVKNVLLYMHRGVTEDRLPHRAGNDFTVVLIDYSRNLHDNFICLDE